MKGIISAVRKVVGRSRGSTDSLREGTTIGATGEEMAARFLQKRGFHILQRNYRYGRGEIDIVARDGETVVFIEVKTAATDEYGSPESWVDDRKQRQVAKIAAAYLLEHRLYDVDCRFDVVAVKLKDREEINYIHNAFWIHT